MHSAVLMVLNSFCHKATDKGRLRQVAKSLKKVSNLSSPFLAEAASEHGCGLKDRAFEGMVRLG